MRKKSSTTITITITLTVNCQNHTMSTASKITLATTTLSAVGIITFVHYGQKAEQSVRPL
jgi:hypothetical protein